ncbi:conserved hypothetical protein [uncultured Gammaproteobacteria bacterium]
MAAALGLKNEIARQAGMAKAVAGTKISGGTIWTGKSLSLGLGLGLGAWGPMLLMATGAAALYGYAEYRKRQQGGTDEEIEQDEGFYPAER